jgi:hypothetical protein
VQTGADGGHCTCSRTRQYWLDHVTTSCARYTTTLLPCFPRRRGRWLRVTAPSVTGTTNLTKIIGRALTSGFRRDVDQICAVLGYYAASCGNCLPAFWDSLPRLLITTPNAHFHLESTLQVAGFLFFSDSLSLKMGLIRRSKTMINSYHTTPCNTPEECAFHNGKGFRCHVPWPPISPDFEEVSKHFKMNFILVRIGQIEKVEVSQSVQWLGSRKIVLRFLVRVIYLFSEASTPYLGPHSLLFNRHWSFPGSKAARVWRLLVSSRGKSTHFRKLKENFSLGTTRSNVRKWSYESTHS